MYKRNVLPSVPLNFLHATPYCEQPPGFHIGPTFKWSTTRTFADYANTLYANPYFIIGLRAGYRTRSGWQTSVEVQNIFNNRCAASVEAAANARVAGDPQIFAAGEGRAIYVGVQYAR